MLAPGVGLGTSSAILDGLVELLVHGLRLQVDAVVLVRRLGQARHAGSLGDSLAVRHHGVGHDEVALGILILQLLQANLNEQLAAACDHVLPTLLRSADDQGIRLGQLLQTFDQLGQVFAILGLHGNLHDKGHNVLHVGNVVGILHKS